MMPSKDFDHTHMHIYMIVIKIWVILGILIWWSRAELEEREDKFDIIVGDLADPVEGGPCYQLYTKSFYENILKPKLNHNGIFVTQVCM